MPFGKNRVGLDFDYSKFLLRLDGKLAAYWRPALADSPDTLNPFVYRWQVPWYQWLKMALVSVTVMPIRILGFVTAFSLAYLVAVVVLAGRRHEDASRPMLDWRRKVLLPLFLALARIAYFCCSVHWIRVRGTRCSPKQAPILVMAPHSAFMDSLFVVFLGMNSVIGKTETADSYFGYLLRMTQPILVTREDPNSRQHTIDQIQKRCGGSAGDWPQLLIFPEGTCTNRSCLINFKTGAFIPGCPVQPVVLRWPNRLDYITWTWDGPGVLMLLWMLFSQLHTFVDIEFLPVYEPSDEEKRDPRLYADNVRAVMAMALGVPTTNYSYENCRHMTLSKKYGLPIAELILEFSRMHERLLLLSDGHPRAMLDRLVAGLNASPVPVSLHTLCHRLAMTDSQALLERVFRFYDQSCSGLLDMRHLVCHLALFSLPHDRALALQYALDAYRTGASSDLVASRCVLETGFGLSSDAVSEILAFIESRRHSTRPPSVQAVLEDIMECVAGPLDMYSCYFAEYNKSTRRQCLATATVPKSQEVAMEMEHSLQSGDGGDVQLSHRSGRLDWPS